MKFTIIIVLLLAIMTGVALFASCAADSTEESLTYVSLRINPEIELIADADGNVVSANAVNEDGEVVLSVIELEGKSVEEAGAAFTQTADELGYLTEEKDTVYIGVESTDKDGAAELTEKLNKNVRDYFNNNGINGKVSAETLEQYADKAAEWGISTGHTKLVMRALDAHPEMSDEEVLALSVKDLMKLLKGNKDEEKIAVGLKSEYRAAVKALKAKYARVFELRTEIDTLKAQFAGELTDAEKSAIEAQIAQKEAELKPLHQAYKQELSELKSSFHEASREARKAYRAEADTRRKESKEKGAA